MNLYRKTVLNTLSSPEQLHQHIKVIDAGTWFILVGIIAFTLSFGIWAFYGLIPSTVTAKSIIFSQLGVVEIYPSHSGQMSVRLVETGDSVTKGQIIAFVPNDAIIAQIAEMKRKPNYDRADLEALLSKYEADSIVTSPVSGIVLMSSGASGEFVDSKSPIFTITNEEKYFNNQQVICYLPVSTSQLLSPGMQVQATPDFVSREEYGYMYGNVVSIGKYPVTTENIKQTLGNVQYATNLLPMNDEAYIELRIELETNAESKNGVAWSNKKGESINLGIGTYCDIQIIIDEIHPYELLFN